MAFVLGIRPPTCLQVGALFIILLSPGRGGVLISIFITWEFGGRGGGGGVRGPDLQAQLE